MDLSPIEPSDSQRLGSLICTTQKKMGQGGVVIWLVTYAGFIFSTALLLIGVFYYRLNNWDFIYSGIFLLALSIFSYMSFRSAQGSCLRFYEHGIEIQKGKRIQRFFIDDLKTMTFSSVRRFVNGAFLGHEYIIVFSIKQGNQETSLKWISIDDDEQPGLEALRQRLSLILAYRMVQDLESKDTVQWVDGVTIQKHGITFRPQKLWRTSEQWQELLFSDIERTDIDERGTLVIYRKGNNKPAIWISTALPNYYPGYRVFCTLLDANHRSLINLLAVE